MSVIVIPDNVPLDQALDLVVRHGLRYDHATRRLLPRAARRDHICDDETATAVNGRWICHCPGRAAQ